MGMAARLRSFLDSQGIRYEVLPHPHTSTSLETARAAHVPGERIAKSVVLEDERGYLMAILPASCRVSLDALERQLQRKLELASEAELAGLFQDCEIGAVPPVADPYGLPAVIDERLWHLSDVYFEAGDHEDLVHLSGEAFQAIQVHAYHGRFSREPH
jgi:Ala-tRNA(Pro) deacylase